MSIAPMNETRHATPSLRARMPSTLEDASAATGAIVWRKGDVPRAMVAAAKSHSATYFRQPCYVGRVWASLDRAGNPITWRHRIASTMRIQHGERAFEQEIRAVDGAADLPYAIPNVLIEHVGAESPGLDTRSWKGAGLAENVFAIECFVDELAALARASPIEYRRRLLANSPHALAALDLAMAGSAWDTALPRGTGRGLALRVARGFALAIVAEVEVIASETRVTHVQQFTDGPHDLDRVAESTAAAFSPAIANALFAATGNRIRTLPITASPKEVS